MTTRADEAPEGWVLHGEKRWITGAGVSRLHLVYCRMSDTPGAEGIGGMEFRVYDSSTTTRPRLEYLINFMTGSNAETEYGAVTLRTPATRPSTVSDD